MSLHSHLSKLAGEAFAGLGLDSEFGEVLPSQRPELAQFQCNGAMQAAKQAGRAPREIAEQVAAALSHHPDIAKAEVAGPGFINIDLTDEALARWAQSTSQDDRLGFDRAGESLTVLVDYGGPNVAKAMHVGHLRATIIGDSLARLFAFAGHNVIRDPHFGDWGFQMGLLIATVDEQKIDPSTITLADLQRIYPEATERAREDEDFADLARRTTVALQQGDDDAREVWSQMKAVSESSQRDDFANLGVEFDLWYGESDVADRLNGLIERLENSGVAELSDGALVVRVDRPDDNREWPPLILRSSAGASLYSTTDVATVEMRVEDLHVDLVLYVVDHRQGDHFTQVFRAARKAGIAPDTVTLEHIGFGTMNGPDGKPFKTRAGGVVRLGDVIEMVTNAARRRIDEAHIAEDYPEEERDQIARQVGVAALKFGDLINNRASDYVFDLDRFSSFEGKTGPYLQYAAVRTKSILRKAAEQGLKAGEMLAPQVDAERDLILELLRFPEVVQRSIDLRAPNHVAEYAYTVSGTWNRFFDQCHILSEPDPARQSSWLALAGWTGDTIETLLHLLGIEVPDRM
ncbi:MAG TPA: arginine--tRNA ligase [Acidimicrobiia bacterium]|nr:arginine--tRNA ligase [Acidimicrobiia bacterium]